MRISLWLAGLAGVLLVAGCHTGQKKEMNEKAMEKTYQRTGSVEVLDGSLLDLLDSNAVIEILADGFKWSEGPVWVDSGKYLLFSDIPPNMIYKWDEKDGLVKYLHPSGYTGTVPRGGEPGSNALILDAGGRLVLCQHGDRRMARMDAPLDSPAPRFITLADSFEGKKFNSPNDAVYHENGSLYFTDPPYGLVKNMDDSSKELDFQGVFRLKPDGKVELLHKDLSRPNGIAFSPDGRKLYVANSDKNKIWMVFDVQADGGIANGKIFFDATSYEEPGAPDGMKVHSGGMIFATGPGGIMVFTPQAKLAGRIRVGDLCSNLAFDAKEKNLYVTANNKLVRVHLK